MLKITHEQAGKLGEQVVPKLRWLVKVQQRMEQLGATPLDSLYVEVTKARNSVHSLSVALHYAAQSHGVGIPGDE